jgi:xylobiose transport system permease protein
VSVQTQTRGAESAEPRPTRERRRGSGSADRTSRPGLIWGVPAVVYFTLFALLPMALVVYLSFTSWRGIGDPKPNGTANWTKLVSDPNLLHSLRITAIFAVGSWVLQTAVALSLGVWAAGYQRNRAILSAIFFVPLVLSSTAIAITWSVLLDPNFGLAGWLGPFIGFPSGNIIGDPTGALMMVIIVGSWQFIPFHMVLYQGAARAVPASLYDASTIDGAGRFAQFFYVTVPLLRNTVVTSSVIIVVGTLTSFETVLILTKGGPGTATRILPYEMYAQGFKSYNMGYGSAIALVLVVVASALSLLMVKLSGYSKMSSTYEGV